MRLGPLFGVAPALVLALWMHFKDEAKLGVIVNKPNAFPGYTLIFPLESTTTYLIDMQGRLTRSWESKYTAGQDAYLLENGHLLRSAKLGTEEAFFAGSGAGGRIQEFTWDGELVWDFKFHNEKQTQHHAITRMPNGNVLMIVWERKTTAEAIEAGLLPELAGNSDTLVDCLIEVEPTGKTEGRIVWEWHVWDHLIQDYDPAKANFGEVAAHAELVDVNFGRKGSTFLKIAEFVKASRRDKAGVKRSSENAGLRKLQGIGYVGAGGGKKFVGFFPDWTHVNAVAYNAELDQIMLSPRTFNEIWIIDHSTTPAESAGHTGGRSGRGGDLLYRWGNPQAHRAGQAEDQRLFAQHDAQWIPAGLPGEGRLLVFNNGSDRPGGNYSSVDEIVLPGDLDGDYESDPASASRANRPLWSYVAPNKLDFFAPHMSGAQRLPNGDTLICTGFGGSVFEVTAEKEIVWKYINPAKAEPSPDGTEGGAIFRAYRYARGYPGLAGKDLRPGPTIEELESHHLDRTR
ncbi:MAG TPA: aryl-sulfate sulfotransferase [Gemmataceae bacterium]|nr:aryl-sulfate sulfotransferase [Gemmataceae bacterium]